VDVSSVVSTVDVTYHLGVVLLHLHLVRDDTDDLGALSLAIGQPGQGRVVTCTRPLHCTPGTGHKTTQHLAQDTRQLNTWHRTQDNSTLDT